MIKLLRKRRKYLYFIIILLLVFYILPNILNFRERRFFSDNKRLSAAKELSTQFTDSIQVIPGEYYRRNKAYTYFFGVKNREMWTTPVYFKIFNYDTVKGGLKPFEIGGSQQTISIRMKDSSGRHWVLRSINKDQKKVLRWWLQPSVIRPVFRDQVSAMNPYGAKVVASLSQVLVLPHTNPETFWMPYAEKHTTYNERIGGRVVYLEEYIDSTWSSAYFNAINIVRSDEMLQQTNREKIMIDTLLYLRIRLFDILISDWDRHPDQWRWALSDTGGKKIFHPVPRDRDMAFYVFDEGIINKLAVRVREKLQSFRKEFGSIKGLMLQSEEMDKKILKGVHKQQFLSVADDIRSKLTADKISTAFKQYPLVIYRQTGPQHEAILTARLLQLNSAAEQFYQLINE